MQYGFSRSALLVLRSHIAILLSLNGHKNGEPTYSHKLSHFIVLAIFCGLYFVCSTATAYADERDEDKQDYESQRHIKGCFASKRRIQSVETLATAKKRHNPSQRKSA